MIASWRLFVTPITAVVLVTGLGLVAREPTVSSAEVRSLASEFRFERSALNSAEVNGRTIRTVEPALAGIQSWISAVGASVALDDISNSGAPTDRCLVDPRDNSVTVATVPGAAVRYQPFALVPRPLPWDSSTMAPMGCAPGDFNEDGLTDLLVFYWGRSPVLFLRSALGPMAANSYVPTELVDPFQIWNTSTVDLADVDGDGHVDIIVGNYFPDGARVLDARASNDPHISMQDSMSHALNAGRNRLLLWSGSTARNAPTARFRQVNGLPADVANSWTLAIGAQDLTGDLLPELYFANDFGPDDLLMNESTPGHVRLRTVSGTRTWTTPKSKALGHDSFKGMGVAFSDLNSDQIPDILVTNITSQYALEESNFAFLSSGSRSNFAPAMRDGRAPYSDRSEELGLSRSGWSWDVKTGDFANTGTDEILVATGFLRGDTNRWPELQELAMGNDSLLHRPGAWPQFQPGDDISGHENNRFYVRSADGRYVDIAGQLNLREGAVSRAIAVADVFRDGRLDFAVANQWGQSSFYRNVAPVAPFVGLSLRLPGAAGGGAAPGTRPAIGASVSLTRSDGVVLTKQVYPANGHTGISSPDLRFGLGGTSTDNVSVLARWRDTRGVHEFKTKVSAGWHTIFLDDMPRVETQGG